MIPVGPRYSAQVRECKECHAEASLMNISWRKPCDLCGPTVLCIGKGVQGVSRYCISHEQNFLHACTDQRRPKDKHSVLTSATDTGNRGRLVSCSTKMFPLKSFLLQVAICYLQLTNLINQFQSPPMSAATPHDRQGHERSGHQARRRAVCQLRASHKAHRGGGRLLGPLYTSDSQCAIVSSSPRRLLV